MRQFNDKKLVIKLYALHTKRSVKLKTTGVWAENRWRSGFPVFPHSSPCATSTREAIVISTNTMQLNEGISAFHNLKLQLIYGELITIHRIPNCRKRKLIRKTQKTIDPKPTYINLLEDRLLHILIKLDFPR